MYNYHRILDTHKEECNRMCLKSLYYKKYLQKNIQKTNKSHFYIIQLFDADTGP